MSITRTISAISGFTADPATVGDKRTLWAIHTLGFYFVAKMFYVFSGGSIQPADALLGILAIFMTPPAAYLKMWQEHRLLILFVAWVQIVNIGWALYETRLDYLLSAAYYLFNLIIVLCAFAIRNRDPALFDRAIIKWILLSIAIQFFVVAVLPGYKRALGTFSNPNQLSYWTICAMSTLLVLRGNRAKVADFPFQIMAMWCQLSSASRAGLGASLMLFLIWMFIALDTPFKKLAGVLGMSFFAVIFFITPLGQRYVSESSQFTVAEERINRQSQMSEMEIRNYNRIFEYYQYTVFGAGEGNLSRFRQALGTNLEIHSTFGTALFSYGVIGFSLLILFLINLAIGSGWSIIIHLVPSLIYSLTHQGLRFSFFWLMIGIIMSVASQNRAARARLRPDKRAPIGPPPVRTMEPRGPKYLRLLSVGPDVRIPGLGGVADRQE